MTQPHPDQPLMESRIVVEAFPLGRNGKVNESGVARLQRPVEMGKRRIEVSYGA